MRVLSRFLGYLRRVRRFFPTWGRSMAHTRSTAEIDNDLRAVTARRVAARERISALSAAIVADTKLIDRLLAERADVLAVAAT